jgi:CheY-like chemotaxis protein
MVVDDERDVLAVTKLMLERSGYQVHAFHDATSALKHVKDKEGCKDCSITISDIKMAEMTGLELARYLKHTRPQMKIVLMTSFPIRREEWRKVLPSTGIDDFISKPFSIEEIADVIIKCSSDHLHQINGR